jgi:hypothetical protein
MGVRWGRQWEGERKWELWVRAVGGEIHCFSKVFQGASDGKRSHHIFKAPQTIHSTKQKQCAPKPPDRNRNITLLASPTEARVDASFFLVRVVNQYIKMGVGNTKMARMLKPVQ